MRRQVVDSTLGLQAVVQQVIARSELFNQVEINGGKFMIGKLLHGLLLFAELALFILCMTYVGVSAINRQFVDSFCYLVFVGILTYLVFLEVGELFCKEDNADEVGES